MIVEARGLRGWNALVRLEVALFVLDCWMSRLDDNGSLWFDSVFYAPGILRGIWQDAELGWSGFCQPHEQ